MVYTADPSAIRDAQKDVDDEKLEIQKQSIQDQIDALDDEINRYNDLIDQINNAADVQIDALEKIKNKWQEVIDQQEHAKNVSLLTGEFGVNAISKILTGNDDDLLMQWKNSYINTLADIDMESQGYIGNMTEQIASLYGIDLSPLQAQFAGIKDSINGINSAIGNGMNVPNYNADAEDNGNNASPTNLTDSITGVGIAAGQSLPNVTSNMDSIAETATNAASSVTSVTDAINNIPESKDVTISIHTVGGGNVSSGAASRVSQIAYTETGNAYADGTKGLTHDEKNALRSEYGQPELTVYPDGKTELTTQPVMSDLPKGTVVYNEEQTKKITSNKASIHGTAYANGTNDEGWFTTPNGLTLRPLQPGDQMSGLIQKWNAYMSSIDNNVDMLAKNALLEQNSQMQDGIKQITNNNNHPSITIGDIHITCPGVTSQEVAKQVGAEINNIFSGLSLKAYQRANITR